MAVHQGSGDGHLLTGTTGAVPVLTSDAVQQLRILSLIPTQLCLLLQSLTNGSDHIGNLVSPGLVAEHLVKGELECNSCSSLWFNLFYVLVNRREVNSVVASVDPLQGSCDDLGHFGQSCLNARCPIYGGRCI